MDKFYLSIFLLIILIILFYLINFSKLELFSSGALSFPDKLNIIIESTKDCPILKSIFDVLKKTNIELNGEKIINKREEIQFENKINSTFYNVENIVILEEDDSNKIIHSIIKEEYTTVSSDLYPLIKINNLNNYEYKKPNNNNRLYELYNIKINYTIEDIQNYFRLIFDLYKVGEIDINIFNDPNTYDIDKGILTYTHTDSKKKYKIPLRILMQAIDEGTTYTRLKEDNSINNIVLKFTNKRPKIFQTDITDINFNQKFSQQILIDYDSKESIIPSPS